jgi:K+-sensing histidine kinase KdpD
VFVVVTSMAADSRRNAKPRRNTGASAVAFIRMIDRSRHKSIRATVWQAPLWGYMAAFAIPISTMLIGTRIGMPAFIFEHLIIGFVVGIAIVWGMGPAVAAALAAALGDNIILRDPAGRPTITGMRDVVDLLMFVAVAIGVGWLVAGARRDRARAEAAAARLRNAREDRDRLVAMVSHDLATPLHVIRGTIQFARRSGSSASLDTERLWVRLDIAAARATSLIRTLGDARALDSGLLSLELCHADVREFDRAGGADDGPHVRATPHRTGIA